MTIFNAFFPILIGLCVLGFMFSIPLLIIGLILKEQSGKRGLFSFSWKFMLGCVIGLFGLVTVWGVLNVFREVTAPVDTESQIVGE